MIGVTETELQILRGVFAPYASKYRFACYGSRVKGGFEKTSDLDVMIFGNLPVSFDDLSSIKQQCDESRLPFIVNFTDFHKADKDFYHQIEKDLVFL